MNVKLMTLVLVLSGTYAMAAETKIYAEDGQYLGKTGASQYDPESTSNPSGPYGSKYSPTSVNNPYGQYGSGVSAPAPAARPTYQSPGAALGTGLTDGMAIGARAAEQRQAASDFEERKADLMLRGLQAQQELQAGVDAKAADPVEPAIATDTTTENTGDIFRALEEIRRKEAVK